MKDIEEFESKYKNSEEELADVKAAYVNFKGDMDRIMESVLCVDYTDEPRIREMIERAIDSGEVPSFKAFVKESKQKMMSRRKRVGCSNYLPGLFPLAEISNAVLEMFVTGLLGYTPYCSHLVTCGHHPPSPNHCERLFYFFISLLYTMACYSLVYPCIYLQSWELLELTKTSKW